MTRTRALVPYAALSVAVAGPLLASGLVLAVDLNLAPHPHLPRVYLGQPESTHEATLNRLPLDTLFVLLGRIGAVGLGEKVLLLAIVLLAGIGMHRAVPVRSNAARYFAGVLYAVNPFVYDRLYTGQWFLLLGYALLPHAYVELARLAEEKRRPWRFAWLAWLVGVASSHMFALLLVLALAMALIRRRGAGAVARGVGLALLPSLYWILPTPGLADFLRHVGAGQLAVYRTVSDPVWGRGVNVAGLYGYWNDAYPVKTWLTLWPLLAAGLVALAVWGIAIHRRRPTTWVVAGAAAFGFVVALGSAAPVTGSIFSFLAEHLSPVRGFREPQKAVALVVFGYAFLGAAAVDDLVRSGRSRLRRAAVAAILVTLPLAYGYRELGGLWGRMATSHYPASWAAADRVLSRDGASRTVFLPWHGYLTLSFAHGRVVANPAAGYFHTRVLVSRDVGEGRAAEDSTDPLDTYISALFAGGQHLNRIGSCLAAVGIDHVLVAKEADYARYGFLGRQRDLAVQRRWSDLVLYRNRAAPSMAATCGGLDVPRAALRPRDRGPYVRNYVLGVLGLLALLGVTVAGRFRDADPARSGRARHRHRSTVLDSSRI